MLYKIDFLVLKFKFFLLEPKFNLLIYFFEFLSIHINHLAHIFLDNMTLKWDYINMFEKIDSFSIIQHSFWFVWL
jgi:hypothetical protein